MSRMRKLKISWGDLEEAFQNGSNEITYRLDLQTGKVKFEVDDPDNQDALDWEASGEDTDSDDEAQATLAEQLDEGLNSRFIEIPRSDSREGYQDMEAFIETVRNPHLRENLEIAIQGKGAFRRFKDVLARSPNLEERERWFQFQRERVHERTRDWLEENGIEADE